MPGEKCILHMAFSALLHFVQGSVPSIQPFNFPSEVTRGQSVTFTCTVLSGAGPYAFRWTKDGGPIEIGPLTRVQTFEEVSLLSLRSVDRSRGGNYTCTVSNNGGSADWTAELAVSEPPEWSIIPEDASVVLGQDLKVDCQAVGIPEPVASWKKIDGGVGSAKAKLYSSDNGSLYIENASLQDGGKYKCTASNKIGDDLKKIITISIHLPPQFHKDYELIRVRSSHSAVLPCEVYGDGPLKVQWSKDYVKESLESRYKIQVTPLPNGLLSELHIPRVLKQDAGIYTCLASNIYGQREKTVKFVVLEPPASPTEIVVKQIGSDEVTIKWAAPYSGNSPVTSYTLQYWVDTGVSPKLQEVRVYSDKTSNVLASLHPGTPYVVRIVAENEFGQSNPSIPVKFSTAEERPSGYPTDLSVISRDSHSLLVRWKAPSIDERNGAIRGYDLGYRSRYSSDQYEFVEVIASTEDNGSHEYVLDKLKTTTEYEISVRAYNGAGRGPLSVPVNGRTLDTDHLVPPVLWVESTSATAILLQWSYPIEMDNNIRFSLYFRQEGETWREQFFSATERSYLLSDLERNTKYEVFLKVTNAVGRSQPTPIIRVTTSDPSSARSSMSQSEDQGVESRSPNTPLFQNATTTLMVIALSVVFSVVVIVCIVAGACVYVVRMRASDSTSRTKAEDIGSRRLSERRPSSEVARLSESQFRYVDVNSRPFLWCSTPAPPVSEYPSPYATLPLRCTPLAKRWQSEVEDGISLAESVNSVSLDDNVITEDP